MVRRKITLRSFHKKRSNVRENNKKLFHEEGSIFVNNIIKQHNFTIMSLILNTYYI